MHRIAKLFILPLLVSCAAVHKHEVQFFDEPFCIERNYRTCHPMEVQVDDVSITIPYGFKTHPSWGWNETTLIAPLILHDYLYSCDYGYSRAYIDEIFFEALIANGVNYHQAQNMYLIMRIFGRLHYFPDINCSIPAIFD